MSLIVQVESTDQLIMIKFRLGKPVCIGLLIKWYPMATVNDWEFYPAYKYSAQHSETTLHNNNNNDDTMGSLN